MKARWLVVGLLAAGGAAAAALWIFGSPEAPAPREERTATQARAERSAAAAAPLGAVAIALAEARPRTSPARQPGPTDERGCGPSGEPCADDELCVDGGCLGTTCAGEGGACALGDGRAGICCEARCVDLASDAANCGRCGASCETGLDCTAGTCLAGSCTGRMAGTPCSASGGRCCRGACVDAASLGEDTSNCGACGHACAPGLSCRQGTCTDPATDAPPTWTCVEPAHACPEGTFCAVDACLPRRCGPDGDGLLCPSPTPGVPGDCCGGRCVDLFSDGEDCGACGRRCGPGQQCQGGSCEGSEVQP